MTVVIDGQTAEFKKSMDQISGKLSGFQSGLGKIAGLAGGAFAVGAVAKFGLEVSKLAGEAVGVQAAFDRLPNHVGVMNDLTSATHGTVSQLDLMKRTVQASNFGISLGALPKLMEFATLRAQQTGQSVDYLVDSIVTGIGRKSPLILDNLGISAAQLKGQLKGVSVEAASIGDVANAVGNIAGKALENMAAFSDNASSKVDKLSASWENYKAALGKAANGTGILGKAMSALNGVIELGSLLLDPNRAATGEEIQSMQLALKYFNKKRLEAIKEGNRAAELEAIKHIATLTNKLGLIRDKPIEDPVGTKQEIETIAVLEARLKGYQDEVTNSATADTAAIAIINKKSQALKEQIEYLRALVPLSRASSSNLPAADTGRRSSTTGLEIFQPEFFNKPKDISSTINITGLGARMEKEMAIINAAFAKNIESGEEWALKVQKAIDLTAEKTINLGPLIAQGLSGFADALGQAAAGVGSFGDNVLKLVAGFMRSFGEQLIALGVAAIAADALVTNPYTAIAAGIALVAIAGYAVAATSKAQKGITGKGGGGGNSRTTNSSGSGGLGGNGFEIQIGGEFRILGPDLVYIFDRNKQLDSRTK